MSRRGLALVALVLAACGGPRDRGERYLHDVGFRRRALAESLLAPDSAYARLRMQHYGRDWEALPVYDPAVAALDGALRTDRARAIDHADGRDAFFRYPAQRVASLDVLPSASRLAALGFHLGPGYGGGLVRVRDPDGHVATALSCASCHARVVEGHVVVGLANQDIDLGALFGRPWPRGQLDVSAGMNEAPVAIPDLRVVSLQSRLQASGAVRNDRIALAIRIETLLITAHGGALRPPREITLALADYLRTLAPAPTLPPPARYLTACAACHETGAWVDAAVVATDPRAADSRDRGTGGYRAPSLRGVGARGALLHDGSVPSVTALLDPARAGGHRFGLELPAADRRELEAYLLSQ